MWQKDLVYGYDLVHVHGLCMNNSYAAIHSFHVILISRCADSKAAPSAIWSGRNDPCMLLGTTASKRDDGPFLEPPIRRFIHAKPISDLVRISRNSYWGSSSARHKHSRRTYTYSSTYTCRRTRCKTSLFGVNRKPSLRCGLQISFALSILAQTFILFS